ncbi:hypothetical protein LguiA_004835 [Lonicera macranthoides]
MVDNHDQDPIGTYFLEIWRQNSKSSDIEMEEENEEEESPTELDTFNSSGGFSVVLPDKLSVHYPTVNLHGHDVGVVQANKPAPVKRLVYYFEIFVKNAGAKGQIAIGFTTEGFKMRRQPGELLVCMNKRFTQPIASDSSDTSSLVSMESRDNIKTVLVKLHMMRMDYSQITGVNLWEANSYGYHGDDGMLYHGQGKGEAFGPTYTTGDTVGGGINYASQELFFTKNGAVVGTVYKDVKGRLFPTVAVHSQNEESHRYGVQDFVLYEVAWGRLRRNAISGNNLFWKHHWAFEEQERAKQQMMIEKIPVPHNASYGIVRSYLLHYGYEDTLNLFDMASHSTVPPVSLVQENGFSEQETYALNQRKVLRQVKLGSVVLKGHRIWFELHSSFVQVYWDDTSAICFMLHCQKFIELVRRGVRIRNQGGEFHSVTKSGIFHWSYGRSRANQVFSEGLRRSEMQARTLSGVEKLEEAVAYGRIEFEKFFKLAEYDDLVKDCAALLAYEQPQKSPVGYLLEESQREVVADAVNAVILLTNPDKKNTQACVHSHLERLLRQLSACFLERRSLNGDQGEAFHLARVLSSSGNKG